MILDKDHRLIRIINLVLSLEDGSTGVNGKIYNLIENSNNRYHFREEPEKNYSSSSDNLKYNNLVNIITLT